MSKKVRGREVDETEPGGGATRNWFKILTLEGSAMARDKGEGREKTLSSTNEGDEVIQEYYSQSRNSISLFVRVDQTFSVFFHTYSTFLSIYVQVLFLYYFSNNVTLSM